MAFAQAGLPMVEATVTKIDESAGKITLDHGNQFTRELTPAVFHQGIAVSLEATMP